MSTALLPDVLPVPFTFGAFECLVLWRSPSTGTSSAFGCKPEQVAMVTSNLRDLGHEVIGLAVSSRNTVPMDQVYGTCQCHADAHPFRNDPDPCIGWWSAADLIADLRGEA